MRYRLNSYSIGIFDSQNINIKFPIPDKVYYSLTTVSGSNVTLDTASTRRVVEAIRLIADETVSYNLCMTGQKCVFTEASKYDEAGIKYVRVTTNRDLLVEFANGDEDDITAIGNIARTDQFTIEVDWGEGMDDIREAILGEPQGIDCPDGIPACDFGDFGKDVLTGDNDYEIAPMSVMTFPEGFGVGAVVRNTGMEQPENYSIAIAADNPELTYYEGQLHFSSGVTWIEMPVNKPYVCIDAIEVTCSDVEGEPFTGILFVYKEADPETVQDVLALIKANGKKLGDYVIAEATDYAAFKAYMQNQIATVLTPIEEEENG